MFEDSEKEMDPTRRAAMFEEIQKRFVEAAPFIFGIDVPYPVAMRKQVKGFIQIPLGNNIFVETSIEA
jgi:peptide/nickel transport system substrate-binding protein